MTTAGPCRGCDPAIRRPAGLCVKCQATWGPEWKCWLPFPPSVNNLFSQGLVKGRIRRFPSKRYKTWREEAVIRIRSAWRSRPPYPVPVIIKLQLVPPDNRARDASNYVKPVEDALVEARVLVDDCQNYVKAVVPWWDHPQPGSSGAVVTVRPARIEQPAPVQGELFTA